MRPRPADLIYRDTPIIVGDPRAAPARFLAVRDARVVAVGPVDETSTWAGPRTRVLSQPNGAILPGFVDAHLHFASAVRLGPKPCPFGPAELPTRLAQARAAAPPGAWLFLAGYDATPTGAWSVGFTTSPAPCRPVPGRRPTPSRLAPEACSNPG
jgi:predicted amidohydrolase YtcJ